MRIREIPPSGSHILHCSRRASSDNAQNDNFATTIGMAATLATFEEIILSPKPGLVDPGDSGSHKDMNWITFLGSAAALAPFWKMQAAEGIMHPCDAPYGELLAKLQKRGVEMECTMTAATGGVNTHKGLIFALSLLAGAAGACIREETSIPAKICATAARIVAPRIDKEFAAIREKARAGKPLANGERIYLEWGLGGIRSEAAQGFPSLLCGLEALASARSKGAAYRDAALHALLTIMLHCEDTNIVHRAGLGFWRQTYREAVGETIRAFDPLRPGAYEPLKRLNRFLIEKNASPGGAADLLACTLFAYRSNISDNTTGIPGQEVV